MDTIATTGSTTGRLACFQKHASHEGKDLLEYSYAPVSFELPRKGITELDTSCPVCRKPVRVAIKSRFEAAFNWWLGALGWIILLPVAAGLLYVLVTEPINDKLARNFMWVIVIGGAISALCSIPYCIYRARHPQFVDHVLLLSGAGAVVGHIGSGQPVPMHEHILHNEP